MDVYYDILPKPIALILVNLVWVNILLSIGVVFIERKNPTSTLLWVMVLNFIPLPFLRVGRDEEQVFS